MKKEDCFNVGYIAKLHGFKGEFNIFLDVDSPSYYNDLDEIYVEINGELKMYQFDRYSPGNNGKVVAKFEGVEGEAEAKKMVGKSLWLPLAFLPPLSGNKFYFHEVIGFEVEDKTLGTIGEIKDVFDGAAQVLLQVLRDKKEILIPVTDQIITLVDRQQKKVFVDVPEGLVEMYLDPNINSGDKDI
ncbi:MAG: ribosome maturation factor RimM [Flavobacteriales bacterium]|nr:ribosome maturation factor RimM [Flavobacteriales bacterium]